MVVHGNKRVMDNRPELVTFQNLLNNYQLNCRLAKHCNNVTRNLRQIGLLRRHCNYQNVRMNEIRRTYLHMSLDIEYMYHVNHQSPSK